MTTTLIWLGTGEEDEDEGLDIGEDGYQVAHHGYLRCVSCGENVTVDQIIYHKRPGDWTKEFCPACHKIVLEVEAEL